MMQNVIGDYATFFDDLFNRLIEIGIDISRLEMSHLGIKFASFEEYERLRDELKDYSKSFSEEEHNGRPIGMMWLKEPLSLSHGCSVDLLELMPPKPNNQYPTGLEHLGVVIGGDPEAFGQKYESVLSGRQDQGPVNKPFFIAFDNGKRVKFYGLSMKEVLAKEGKQFISL